MRNIFLLIFFFTFSACSDEILQPNKLSRFLNFKIDSQDIFWFINETKLYKANIQKIDTTYVHQLDSIDLPIDAQIRELEIDDDDAIWLATSSGILKYKNQNWEIFDSSNTCLSSNNIKQIEISETKDIWGLVMIKDSISRERFTSIIQRIGEQNCKRYETRSFLKENTTTFKVKNNKIWFASKYSRLTTSARGEFASLDVSNNTLTKFPLPHTGEEEVLNIFIDKKERIWCEIYVYAPTRNSPIHSLSLLKNDNLQELESGNNFHLAENINDKLVILKSSSWSNYPPNTHYSGASLSTYSDDSLGTIIPLEGAYFFSDLDIDNQNTIWYLKEGELDFFK